MEPIETDICSLSDIEAAYFMIQCQQVTTQNDSTKESFETAIQQISFKKLLADLNLTFLLKSIPIYSGDDRALLIAIGQLQEAIKTKLEGKGYYGDLVDVGSTVDQSKVQLLDEVDMLFVVGTGRGYTTRGTEKPHVYHVTKCTGTMIEQVQPRKLRESFAQDIQDIVLSLELPKGLVHSGYSSPEFSGVRFNGPATTLLMTWDPGKESRQISMDITLVLKLPVDDEQRIQQEILLKFEKLYSERHHDISRVPGIHLFPNPISDRWELSTAGFEAYILEKIPRETPLKMSIQLCKAIASKLAALPLPDAEIDRHSELPVREITSVTHVLSAKDQGQSKEFMKYGHAFLTPECGKKFNEITKKAISLNSAAIKHIALHSASKRCGAFRVRLGAPEQEEQLIRDLISDIFGYLSSQKQHVEHFFLGSRISLLSISTWANLLYQTGKLITTLKAQCLQIARLISQGPNVLNRCADSDVESLGRYTVPAANLQYAENTYRVPTKFSGEGCNETFLILLQLINATGNSTGGIIQVYDDSCSETDNNLQTTWLDAFKGLCTASGLSSNIRVLTDETNKNCVQFRVDTFPDTMVLPVYTYTEISLARGSDDMDCMATCDNHYTRNDVSYSVTTSRRLTRHMYPYQAEFDKGETDTPAETPTDIKGGDPEHMEAPQVVAAGVRRDPMAERLPTESMGSDSAEGMAMTWKGRHHLSWTRHRDAWKQDLKQVHNRLDVNVTSILESGETFLKLSKPISFMPSRSSVLRSYGQHGGFVEALQAVELTVGDTEALAIVSKNFPSCLSGMDHIVTPDHHLVDVLSIDQLCNIHLWCFLSHTSNALEVDRGWVYLLEVGYVFKCLLSGHSLSQQQTRTNAALHCHLYTLPEHIRSSSVITYPERNVRHVLSNLATAFLQKESVYKDRLGLDVGIHLTAKQLDTVIKSEFTPVSFIEGPPGSGKTFIAFYLCSKYKRVNYICSTLTYKAYLDFQRKCTSQLIRDENDMQRYTKECIFGNFDCIILDDAHQLSCSYKTWERFVTKAKKSSCKVYIFADNRYQNFKNTHVKLLRQCIEDLSEDGDNPFHELHDIHRNARKVVSFLVSCAAAQETGDINLSCSSEVDGDDVEIQHLKGIFDDSPENKLIQLTLPMVFSLEAGVLPQYDARDVAIMVDTDHPAKDAERLIKIFTAYSPGIPVHSASSFPVKGITIDALDNFMGFDRQVCICITTLESTVFKRAKWRTLQNPKYRAFVASRGVTKVIFVTNSKLDQKMADVMGMNKKPSDPRRLWAIGGTNVYAACWLTTDQRVALLYTADSGVSSELKLISVDGEPLHLKIDDAVMNLLHSVTSSPSGDIIVTADVYPLYIRILRKQADGRYCDDTYLHCRDPRSVCLTSFGELLIMEVESDTLRKYSLSENRLIWSRAVDVGCGFSGALTVDTEGRAYVAGITSVSVYDANGTDVRSVKVAKEQSNLCSVCVDSSSKWMFTGHEDGTVSLFREDEVFRRRLIVTKKAVRSMSLHNDQHLAIASEKGLYLYDVAGVLL